MKQFIFKSTFLLLSLWFAAYFIEKYVDSGLIKSGQSYYPIWNDIIESKINADLIIQGNSRAWMQINPLIIDSGLNLNSYNIGVNGYTFKMQYYRFLLYIKHNKKPNYIIQSVDCVTTLPKMNDLFEFEQFLPYLDDTIIRSAVKEYPFFDNRDFFIPLYKYSHSLLSKRLFFEGAKTNLIGGTMNQHKYKGFKSTNGWDKTAFNNLKNEHPLSYRRGVDSLTKMHFEWFLDYCSKERIKIIFVFTPEFFDYQKLQLDRDSIKSIFYNYASKYKISIIDYSNDSICLDSNNFFDSFHLNSNGVDKFNVSLLKDLTRIIK